MQNTDSKNSNSNPDSLPKKAKSFRDLIAKNPSQSNVFKGGFNQNLKNGGAKFNPAQFKTQHKGGS